MSSTPNNKAHRTPAKSTPFSTAGAGKSVDRLAMSNSIRKAKRFQTVARKRHMTYTNTTAALTSSSSLEEDMIMTVLSTAKSSLSSSTTGRENPYSRDGEHIREIIDLVISIVQRIIMASCGDDYDGTSTSSLPTQLERICVLLSPHENNDDYNYDLTTGRSRVVGDDDYNTGGGGGSAANYDSAMAGIAANSILSQFITNTAAAANSYIRGLPLLQQQHQQQHQHQHQREQTYSPHEQPRNGEGMNNNLAFLFAHALSRILHSDEDLRGNNNINNNNINNNNSRQGIQITAAIILSQLAATEPPPPPTSSSSSLLNQEEYSPYGHPSTHFPLTESQISSIPPSWCYVLVHSPALHAIVQHIHPLSNNYYAPKQKLISNNFNNDRLHLCEKCVWATGNLAGDSELARMTLLREDIGIVPKLMDCLVLGLGMMEDQPWGQPQQQLESFQTVIELLRNTIWAIINLFRGGGISASDVLDLQQQQPPQIQQNLSGIKRYHRLSSHDVGRLLSLSDESFPTATTTTKRGMKATWDDVANETCWLLSYLSQNDTSVAEFLCNQWDNYGTNVLSTMVERLAHATDALGDELLDPGRSRGANDRVAQNMEYLIPCCRALKHIAMASDGQFSHFMDHLLLAKTPTTKSDTPAVENGIRPFETSVAKLISFGTLGSGNTVSNIASEAASLAGSCLYDAGIQPNSAASAARGTLLPALCHAIVSPLSKFDFQREVVWALWFAVGLSREVMEDIYASNISSVIQSDLVGQFIRLAPPDSRMARALTDILSAMDADASEAALRLIDLLLRWHDDSHSNISMNDSGGKKVAIVFEEAGLVDALWRICDNDTDESDTAELAAKILDDFYDRDGEDDVEYEGNGMSNGQFQFRVSHGCSIPEGGFNFGSAPR